MSAPDDRLESQRRCRAKERERLGPELLDLLIELRPQLPKRWLDWSDDEQLEYLRCRLRFSQKQLGQKSGLSQSRVSLIEGGADACVSTWRKVYAAMGFRLLLLPVTELDYFALKEFCERGRRRGHWALTPARPRRRWRKREQQKNSTPPAP